MPLYASRRKRAAMQPGFVFSGIFANPVRQEGLELSHILFFLLYPIAFFVACPFLLNRRQCR